jgi:hypothetical protein
MATTSSLLRDHVTLSIRSTDRVFSHAYCPGLMTQFQVIRFLLHRGFPIPSPAALGKIGKAFVAAMDRYIADNGIPLVRFKKGTARKTSLGPTSRRPGVRVASAS